MNDKIRESDLYKKNVSVLPEDDIKIVDETISDLHDPILKLLNMIKSVASDEEGFSLLMESFEKSTTSEEVDRWQEKS